MGNRSWQRRESGVLQKRTQKGANLVMSVRIARAPGDYKEKPVFQSHEQAGEAYTGAVFESKKEIPKK